MLFIDLKHFRIDVAFDWLVLGGLPSRTSVFEISSLAEKDVVGPRKRAIHGFLFMLDDALFQVLELIFLVRLDGFDLKVISVFVLFGVVKVVENLFVLNFFVRVGNFFFGSLKIHRKRSIVRKRRNCDVE